MSRNPETANWSPALCAAVEDHIDVVIRAASASVISPQELNELPHEDVLDLQRERRLVLAGGQDIVLACGLVSRCPVLHGAIGTILRAW